MARTKTAKPVVHSGQHIRIQDIREGKGGIATAFLDFRRSGQAAIAPIKTVQKFERRDDLDAMNGSWPEFTKEFITDIVLADDMLASVFVGPKFLSVRSAVGVEYLMARINDGLAVCPYKLATDDSDERIG